MNKKDLVLSLPQRLFLFVCLFILGYVVTLVACYVLGMVIKDNVPALLRLSSVVQDVMAFIVPAVATAVLCTRRPAELLCLTGGMNFVWIALLGAVLFFSIPFQEAVIYWNQNVSLPPFLNDFEQMARAMEAQAEATSRIMLSNTSNIALIVNILIIGVAAGVSEELLFRGCFQRLLVTGGINHHIAIWTVAFVFSFIHFQFFGFVPRLLLGAYFGYLLYWSKSVWIPAIAHSLNNIMVVITAWGQMRLHPDQPLDTATALPAEWQIAASVVLTAITLAFMFKLRKSDS
ncbi:MAG: CPBP family intramembrane metalloprotease [Bacteroidales bacterium]|nr:CPBP family intramembrane metalloprotease [Bacteroidales bacterium]